MYFKVEEEEKIFKIFMTAKFYEMMDHYYKGGSYFSLFYRLYNLLPQDFYHFIGYKYHASFKKNAYLNNFIEMFFTNKKDAQLFCEDVNNRFSYCIQNFMG